MGNVESTIPPRLPSDTPPDYDGSSPGSLRRSSSHGGGGGGSDDEWQGYDKVIVSHNLAEEILDEIYGKLEPSQDEEAKEEAFAAAVAAALKESSAADNNTAGGGGSSSSSQESSNYYEDFASLRSEGERQREADRLEKETLMAKKSLADEILDELYGRNAEKFDNNGTASDAGKDEEDEMEKVSLSSVTSSASSTTSKGGKSVKFNISKDDSELPDNKSIIGKCINPLSISRMLQTKGKPLIHVLCLEVEKFYDHVCTLKEQRNFSFSHRIRFRSLDLSLHSETTKRYRDI